MKKRTLSMVLVLALLVSIFGNQNVVQAKTSNLKFLTKAVYDEMGGFSEGLTWAKKGENFVYLDRNGKVVIDLSKKKYQTNHRFITQANSFHNGYAIINADDGNSDTGTFIIDKKGNVVLTREKLNKAMKKSGKEVYYLDSQVSEDGTVVFNTSPYGQDQCVYNIKTGKYHWYETPELDYWWYTEGLKCQKSLSKKNNDGKWGYVDINFKHVIPAKFDRVRPFHDGLAAVKINEKWGFINKKGKIVIRPQFSNFAVHDYTCQYEVFNNGIACVQKNGKWGAIDKTGKTVIDFKYKEAFTIADGYAVVRDNKGQSYYVTLNGKTMISKKFTDANYFTKDGVALVERDGVYQLINKKGNKVCKKTWKLENSYVTLEEPNMVLYQKDGKWGVSKIK